MAEDIAVPRTVLDRLRRAGHEHWNGRVLLHLENGHIRKWEVTEVGSVKRDLTNSPE